MTAPSEITSSTSPYVATFQRHPDEAFTVLRSAGLAAYPPPVDGGALRENMLRLACVVLFTSVVALGCSRAESGPSAVAAASAAGSSSSVGAAPSAGVLSPTSGESKSLPPPAKFKVTSAKPAEVETALKQGWKLTNCSITMASHTSSGTVIIEHCYFLGDESLGGSEGAQSPK